MGLGSFPVRRLAAQLILNLYSPLKARGYIHVLMPLTWEVRKSFSIVKRDNCFNIYSLFLKSKLENEKEKLAADLESARELSHRVIADRMQLQAEKTILVQQLQEQAKLTNLLEVQLRK